VNRGVDPDHAYVWTAGIRSEAAAHFVGTRGGSGGRSFGSISQSSPLVTKSSFLRDFPLGSRGVNILQRTTVPVLVAYNQRIFGQVECALIEPVSSPSYSTTDMTSALTSAHSDSRFGMRDRWSGGEIFPLL